MTPAVGTRIHPRAYFPALIISESSMPAVQPPKRVSAIFVSCCIRCQDHLKPQSHLQALQMAASLTSEGCILRR